jgi:gliding motility-associated-like protein
LQSSFKEKNNQTMTDKTTRVNWVIGALMTIWSVIPGALPAQILPPDFLCVSNDTLFWELPVNTCGPFNSYIIYASQNINGPYSVLSTITNAAQTSFFHQDANDQLWFYYMQSDFNCLVQPVLSSDTLDNRIPEPGPLRYVTVEDGNVFLSWSPSPSPEVFAYIISRNTAAGTTIIDTVFSGLTYLDTGAAPDEIPETYFVVALDRCGNTSLVTNPHNTVFLEASEASSCNRSITLSWNPYQNWSDGVAEYQIWTSVDGGDFEPAGETGGSATSFVYEEADDMATYCFFVRAVEAGSGMVSNSNTVCQTLDIVQPVTDFVLKNATVTSDNIVRLEWNWNPVSEISTATVERSSNNTNFSEVADIPLSIPLNFSNVFEDTSADPGAGQFFYRINTVDDCDRPVISNPVGTVFLKGQAQSGGTNALDWSEFFHGQGEVISYELFRLTGGAPLSLGEYSPQERSHLDEVNLADPDETTACYYVIATADVSLPGGGIERVQSRSNTVCVEQFAQVFVPNAFVPDGINKVFKPVLQFGMPDEYLLAIYDRWGGKLFESRSLEEGWNGKKDGRAMPQGVYLYLIQFRQSNGRMIEKKGTIMLLR